MYLPPSGMNRRIPFAHGIKSKLVNELEWGDTRWQLDPTTGCILDRPTELPEIEWMGQGNLRDHNAIRTRRGTQEGGTDQLPYFDFGPPDSECLATFSCAPLTNLSPHLPDVRGVLFPRGFRPKTAHDFPTNYLREFPPRNPNN
jgi:hypothetical protein